MELELATQFTTLTRKASKNSNDALPLLLSLLNHDY